MVFHGFAHGATRLVGMGAGSETAVTGELEHLGEVKGDLLFFKIDKAEAGLDWRLPAAQLARQVRAFNPFPGAAARVGGNPLKVWRAEVDDAPRAPAAWGRPKTGCACWAEARPAPANIAFFSGRHRGPRPLAPSTKPQCPLHRSPAAR